MWTAVNACGDVVHHRTLVRVKHILTILVHARGLFDDDRLHRGALISEHPVESTVRIGQASPVGQPLGLIATEDIPLGPLWFLPAITAALAEHADHVRERSLAIRFELLTLLILPLLGLNLATLGTEPFDDRIGDGLFNLTAPLADQVVGAQDKGSILTALAALIAGPLGVHMDRCSSDDALADPHFAADKA